MLSTRPVMRRSTPDSLSRRTRLSVAAGDSPTSPRELDVGAIGVGLKLYQQPDVNRIK